ncbi:hypothetical protein LJC27_01170 [Christensenellaceae bacterium OttesenSCG-928-M15]|nr:hypothetical protein [Christensenellaceae bacterium OttesenSCG-928-M15]
MKRERLLISLLMICVCLSACKTGGTQATPKGPPKVFASYMAFELTSLFEEEPEAAKEILGKDVEITGVVLKADSFSVHLDMESVYGERKFVCQLADKKDAGVKPGDVAVMVGTVRDEGNNVVLENCFYMGAADSYEGGQLVDRGYVSYGYERNREEPEAGVVALTYDIRMAYTKKDSVLQNFKTVANFIVAGGGNAYDEIRYIAYYTEPGAEQEEIISFRVDKETIDKIIDGSVMPENMDEHVKRLYIKPELTEYPPSCFSASGRYDIYQAGAAD